MRRVGLSGVPLFHRARARARDLQSGSNGAGARRLEGSRFVGRQFYVLTSSGSRELPIVAQLYRLRVERSARNKNAGRKRNAGLFSGAACLPRTLSVAANLQN